MEMLTSIGKILQDEKTLEFYKIEEKGFIVCMVSKVFGFLCYVQTDLYSPNLLHPLQLLLQRLLAKPLLPLLLLLLLLQSVSHRLRSTFRLHLLQLHNLLLHQLHHAPSTIPAPLSLEMPTERPSKTWRAWDSSAQKLIGP
jgi:hypothetical protein